MQIFIVYARIRDFIIPVQIIIRFYPSSTRARRRVYFEIYLVVEIVFTNVIIQSQQ